MIFKNFLIIIFFFLFSNCTTVNHSTNKQKIIFKKSFINKGFALIYDQKDYDDDLISNKIDERELIIFQKNLETNTKVKVTNILNNKSLLATVGESSKYPFFFNSVLSKRIAVELNLNINEPYVEIFEIPGNSLYVAKKAKTFDEERNVAIKAPVNNISINDLNKDNKTQKIILKKKFSYKIKIADFYFNDTAKIMIERIINETEIKTPKITKTKNNKYRVFVGPFSNIKSLQKSYNDISILGFENIEIIKND
jgi:hypothetical protein